MKTYATTIDDIKVDNNLNRSSSSSVKYLVNEKIVNREQVSSQGCSRVFIVQGIVIYCLLTYLMKYLVYQYNRLDL